MSILIDVRKIRIENKLYRFRNKSHWTSFRNNKYPIPRLKFQLFVYIKIKYRVDGIEYLRKAHKFLFCYEVAPDAPGCKGNDKSHTLVEFRWFLLRSGNFNYIVNAAVVVAISP